MFGKFSTFVLSLDQLRRASSYSESSWAPTQLKLFRYKSASASILLAWSGDVRTVVPELSTIQSIVALGIVECIW